MYPNPATDNITLVWLSEEEGIVDVRVVSSKGTEVFKKTYVGEKGNNNQLLSVKQFSKGLYFVEVTYSGTQEQYKLVIH